MKPDLSTWITKTEAAYRLGVSTKSIDRMAEAKKLKKRTALRNQQRTSVFDPIEIAEQAATRGIVNVAAAAPVTALATTSNGGIAKDGEAPADSPRLVSRSFVPVPVPVTHKLWLTIPEATEYSGLPKTWLRREIKTGGRLAGAAAKFGVSWRINRFKLLDLSGYALMMKTPIDDYVED